ESKLERRARSPCSCGGPSLTRSGGVDDPDPQVTGVARQLHLGIGLVRRRGVGQHHRHCQRGVAVGDAAAHQHGGAEIRPPTSPPTCADPNPTPPPPPPRRAGARAPPPPPPPPPAEVAPAAATTTETAAAVAAWATTAWADARELRSGPAARTAFAGNIGGAA